jgi:SAM-dependent methyltransferase
MRYRRNWQEYYCAHPVGSSPWECSEMPPVARRLLADLPLGGLDDALDVGCGWGQLTVRLQQLTGLSVTGIDIAERVIDHANLSHGNPGSSLRFIRGDVLQMPFGAGSFDLVFDRGCLHHLSSGVQRDVYFEQVHRVIRPEGYLLVCAMGADPRQRALSLLTRAVMRGVNPLGPTEVEERARGRFDPIRRDAARVGSPVVTRLPYLRVPVPFQFHLLRRLGP